MKMTKAIIIVGLLLIGFNVGVICENQYGIIRYDTTNTAQADTAIVGTFGDTIVVTTLDGKKVDFVYEAYDSSEVADCQITMEESLDIKKVIRRRVEFFGSKLNSEELLIYDGGMDKIKYNDKWWDTYSKISDMFFDSIELAFVDNGITPPMLSGCHSQLSKI